MKNITKKKVKKLKRLPIFDPRMYDKNNQYMLKLQIGEWVKCVTRTRVRVTR